MKFPRSKTLLTLGMGLLGAQAVQAAMVSTTSAGTPILRVINPKTVVTPTPTVCTQNGLPPTGQQLPVETQSSTLTTGRVDGLPGSAALPGYILKSSRSANIVVNGVTIGTLYDRVYCLGTGTTCNATNTYTLALRTNLNTAVWKPGVTQSFEINNFFRAIKSTVTAADVGYYMGTVGGAVPDHARAGKYMEYAGRTFKGLNQITPPGNVAADRNNAWMMFWQDSNANDPERCEPHSLNSPWSPWFYVRQTCATGYNTTPQNFKLKFWQGGEEGQLQQNIQTTGYICN